MVDVSERVTRALACMERREPRVRALLPEPGRRDRLLREAAALAARAAGGREAGQPLAGTLLAVKDIFAVDGFETRAGSALPEALFRSRQATCVSRLRAAGALVLGKSVTTEFAYFEPGATTNPHDPTRTPGGSSSGSAAAVAAGYADLALGSQTVGSVIRPAAYCGVVGFKPSFGRIPTDGMLHFSPSVDHVGLFARELPELARAAALVCDGWTPVRADGPPVLGVPDGSYLAQTEPEARAQFELAVQGLLDRGLNVRRVPLLDDVAEINDRHQRLIAAEFAAVHRDWFREYGPLYRARSAMLYDHGSALAPEVIAAGRASGAALRERLEAAANAHGIDLWLTPAATGPAPRGLSNTGDPAMNLPFTHAGLPTLTLPAGTSPTTGTPLGLQLTAPHGRDEHLLSQAQSTWGRSSS